MQISLKNGGQTPEESHLDRLILCTYFSPLSSEISIKVVHFAEVIEEHGKHRARGTKAAAAEAV